MSVTPAGLCVDRWDRPEPPTASEMEKRLRAEGLSPYRYSDPPGTAYPPHRHRSREVRWLLSGKLRVRLDGRLEAIILAAGDRLDLPAGLLHEVLVEGDEPAVLVAAEGRSSIN